MADIRWIKIDVDIFEDEKILLIEALPESDSIICIWLKLLTLAGKMNNSGVFLMNGIIPYTEKMLATIFRRKESTVHLAMQTFEEFGMIDVVDGVITIPNWGKHQSIERIENIREYQREYHRRYREKQKLIASASEDKVEGKVVGKVYDKLSGKACVNDIDKEKDKDKDIEKEKDISITTDPAPPDAVAVLPMTKSRYYKITADMVAQWETIYTAVDIRYELAKMGEWYHGNGSGRQKTSGKSVRQFISNWLSKAQNEASSGRRNSKAAQTSKWAPGERPIDSDEADAIRRLFE